MRILKYSQKIKREKGKKGKKGDKLYDGKKTPLLPDGWQKPKKLKKKLLSLSEILDGTVNHIIVPEDDLIVIDCDTKESVDEVYKLISKKDYVVESDTPDSCHFYFRTTKYSKKKLGSSRRKTTNKIDLLMGKSLIFTPNRFNKTKTIAQGSLDKVTEIPKKLVKYLEANLKKVELFNGDSSKNSNDKQIPLYYLGEDIKNAITNYKQRGKKFKYLYPIFEYITPANFRDQVEPTLHPNLIKDGEGINYLQAVIAKIGGDPTINLKLTKRLIEIIALELWDEPLDKGRLDVLLNSIKHQKYSDGSKVFTYNKNIKKEAILIRHNDSPPYPLYRTIDDTYIQIRNKKVITIEGFSNLKRFIRSSKVTAEINGKVFKQIKEDHIANIETVEIKNSIMIPTGLSYDALNHVYIYNKFEHTREFETLKFTDTKDFTDFKIKGKNPIIKIPTSIPTIKKIFENITADHENQELHISRLLMFLARKLTTLEYSPLVFLLLGAEGTGKSLFTSMLDRLTSGVAEVVLDNKFNSEFEQSLFLYEDEGRLGYDTLNRVKQLSGNANMRIEGKGINAYTVPNVSTVLINSNKSTTLADSMKSRRFVHLLSFEANKLKIKNVKQKIDNEIGDFARLLKGIANNPKLEIHIDNIYMDAGIWHDEASSNLIVQKLEAKAMGAEEGEESSTRAKTLGLLLSTYKDSNSLTVLHQLEHIFGKDFKFGYTRKNQTAVQLRILVGDTTPTNIKGIDITNNSLNNKDISIYGIRVKRDYRVGKRRYLNIVLPEGISDKVVPELNAINCISMKKLLKEHKSLVKLNKM